MSSACSVQHAGIVQALPCFLGYIRVRAMIACTITLPISMLTYTMQMTRVSKPGTLALSGSRSCMFSCAASVCGAFQLRHQLAVC